MCTECFQEEYSRFDSDLQFEELHKQLISKKSISVVGSVPECMGEPRFWLFGFIGIGSKKKPSVGYDIFQCSNCGQKWKLSAPDYAWRGFFLRIENRRYIDHSGREHFLEPESYDLPAA